MKARVLKKATPVEVTKNADVVGAVKFWLVPLMLLRKLDGLQIAAGFDGSGCAGTACLNRTCAPARRAGLLA
jgi:hypothetical protein